MTTEQKESNRKETGQGKKNEMDEHEGYGYR